MTNTFGMMKFATSGKENVMIICAQYLGRVAQEAERQTGLEDGGAGPPLAHKLDQMRQTNVCLFH